MNQVLQGNADSVARALLGYELRYHDQRGVRGGIIVETEAYAAHDPASHSHMGKSPRNAAMFEKPGSIYIYLIYGMYYCLNIVCGNHDGQAVLIRALQPTRGIKFMKKQRNTPNIHNLCSGPAKLFQALDIDPRINTQHIDISPFSLYPSDIKHEIVSGNRIGISKGTDTPWRFYIANNMYVSK